MTHRQWSTEASGPKGILLTFGSQKRNWNDNKIVIFKRHWKSFFYLNADLLPSQPKDMLLTISESHSKKRDDPVHMLMEYIFIRCCSIKPSNSKYWSIYSIHQILPRHLKVWLLASFYIITERQPSSKQKTKCKEMYTKGIKTKPWGRKTTNLCLAFKSQTEKKRHFKKVENATYLRFIPVECVRPTHRGITFIERMGWFLFTHSKHRKTADIQQR